MNEKLERKKAKLNLEIEIAETALKDYFSNFNFLYENINGNYAIKRPKFNIISFLLNLFPKSSFLGKILVYYKSIKGVLLAFSKS